MNLENSFNNGNNIKKSIECFADNIKLTCVWQQPEVNMHIINQVLNQINIYDDNSYDDRTPTNISDLISASFPSSANFGEEDMNNVSFSKNKIDSMLGFEASTPISDKSSQKIHAEILSKEEDFALKAKMLILAFQNTSPIMMTSRQRLLYTKKRLEMN